MDRAVFLDRDGVLNRELLRGGKPYPPSQAGEMQILPEAFGALTRLKAAGYRLIVVTNQPDVARGSTTIENVEALNGILRQALPVDEIRTCFHDDRQTCQCRKPKPGMLLDAARDWGLDLARCWMVGDRWRDIDAGHAAGCRTVWIDRQYEERGPSSAPDFRVRDVEEAAARILETETALES